MISIRSQFLKSVLTLMVGAVFAQLVAVSVYPIITRLYSPHDFGVFELFVSIFSILGSVATLKYEQAIVLPKEDGKAFDLTKISIFFCILVSTLLLIVFAAFSLEISRWFKNPAIEKYLLLIPFMVFFTAFFSSVRYLAIRKKEYSLISKVTTFKSIVSSASQVLFGAFQFGSLGLILSQILSNSFLNFHFFKKVRGQQASFVMKNFDSRKYLRLMAEYKDFPKFAVAGTLANSLVLYGSALFVFKLFSVEVLGYLALANRILSVPLFLISNAVGDVFLQKVAEEKHSYGNAKNSFRQTFFLLLFFSLSAAAIGYFIFPILFPFVFGSEWKVAGQYASILIFLYAIRFINTPLSNVYVVFNRQGLALLGTIVQFILLAILFIYTYNVKLSFHSYLVYFVLSQSVFYAGYLFVSWKVASKEESSNGKYEETKTND